MKLSDGTMMKLVETGELGIDPDPEDVQWQPCSIDLRLGTSFMRIGGPRVRNDRMSVTPGEFLLASTKERVRMGRTFMGEVHGKSSWARRGLQVHAAGLLDPGFEGQITLELFNMSDRTIPLRAGDFICQMTVERLDWPATRPYGHPSLNSHYQHQTGVMAAEGS